MKFSVDILIISILALIVEYDYLDIIVLVESVISILELSFIILYY